MRGVCGARPTSKPEPDPEACPTRHLGPGHFPCEAPPQLRLWPRFSPRPWPTQLVRVPSAIACLELPAWSSLPSPSSWSSKARLSRRVLESMGSGRQDCGRVHVFFRGLSFTFLLFLVLFLILKKCCFVKKKKRL